MFGQMTETTRQGRGMRRTVIARAMRVLAALVVLLSLMAPGGAALAQSEPAVATADIRPVAVTVFPTGARVRRAGTVSIAPGAGTLVIPDLPESIDRRSIRIEASGEQRLLLGPVDLKTRVVTLTTSPDGTTAPTDAERAQLEEALEAAEAERATIQTRIERAQTQRTLMRNLAQLPLQPVTQAGPSPATPGGATDPAATWGALFDLIGERLATADGAITTARAELRELEKRIEELQRRLSLSPPRQVRRLEVQVPITNFADAPVEAEVALTYQVRSASWSPLYEARLSVAGAGNGSDGELLLTRRAQISQRTGEDWANVALTLSTTIPSGRTAIPELTTLPVDFYEPPQIQPRSMRTRALSRSAAPTAGMAAIEPEVAGDAVEAVPALAAAPKLRRADVATARISSGAFQATYEISGETSVASDGQPKQVLIAETALPVALARRAVPSRDRTVYLAAVMTMPEELRILPGTIALFRDGVYVGQGRLPQLAGGAEHELGFGSDDRVTVTYDAQEDTRGETGTFTTSNTRYRRYAIGIENQHDRAVTVRVIDRLPVSRNEDITVTPLGAAKTPDVRQVERRPGVIAWDVDVAKGAKRDLDFGYQVSWPKDKEITLDRR